MELDRGFRAGEVLDRGVALPRLRVVEHEVAMRERAALGVLPRQPYGDAFDEQGGEGERLGVAPVDAALVERSRAALELSRELRMDGEALLHPHELAVESAQAVGFDGGDDLRR